MSTVTTQNFNVKLGNWKRSAGSLRQNAQDILVFGMAHYAAHGDAGYLSRMYQAACDTRGVNAATMRDWIRANANVVLKKDKDGKSAFRKESKKVDPHVSAELGNWWEYGKEKKDAAPNALKVSARIQSLATAIENAQKAGTEVDVAEYEAALKKLEAAIAAAKRVNLSVAA